jgi:MerR family transcriptional regulator, light-induced transcriptional regulator
MSSLTPTAHESPIDFSPYQADYLDAIQKGSGREADKVVQRALDMNIRVNQIYLNIFQSTAYQIGRLWQRNEFSVAQEHLATAIIERQMGDLHSLFKPIQQKQKTLVIGCVDKELHRLGSRMVADFIEQDGWTVYYLGATVPSKSLIAMAGEMKADLIGLASQLIYRLPAISEFMVELKRSKLGGTPVMVGGMPFVQQPELYKSLGVPFSAVDASDAVRLANQIIPDSERF